MTNPYRELFAVPGAKFFVAAGIIGRMSMSMIGIGIVLMVTSVTGSYGTAGEVSATCALAFAAGAPIGGRLADRYGQGRVLRPLVLANAASLTFLVLCAVLGFPIWLYFVAAALTGATSPSLGAMVRARWSHALREGDGPALHLAFSFESVADELIFVMGPMLVTALATGLYPASGLATAGLLTLVGCLTLATQHRTQPPPRPLVAGGDAGSVFSPGMILLCVIFLLMGSVFGAFDVSAIAFAKEQGHEALAGVLLGCYAAGSASGGLWYGAQHWKTPLDRRFRITLALVIIGLVPMTVISNLWIMMGAVFFSGLAISPTLISGFGLIERLVPSHRLTEGLTFLSTFIGIGVAIGAPSAGRLVDAFGAGRAFLFPLSAGLIAVVVGVAGTSQFSKHELSS